MTEALVVVVSSRPVEDTLNALVARVKHRQVFGMLYHAANVQAASAAGPTSAVYVTK